MTLGPTTRGQSVKAARAAGELATHGGDRSKAIASASPDIGLHRNQAAKWAAITEYVRRSSREGIAEAEGALRRLEQRVGALLGPATVGSHHSVAAEGAKNLAKDARSEFRLMAEHPDIVGRPTTETSVATDVSRHARSEFRLMAEHPDIVGSHHSVAAEGAKNLAKDARSEFRLMAEHPDIVEQVIAESTDASPPSRATVVTAIRDDIDRQQRHEVDTELAARVPA